jgi:hypothetical protein
MKSINENTTLIFKLRGSQLLNCNIDWKAFTKASISLLINNCNLHCEKYICICETYDLKSLPDDFSDILNESKECMWQIELNTLLDIDYIDYINTAKKLAFATGMNERLGKESFVSLLDEDLLRLIWRKF